MLNSRRRCCHGRHLSHTRPHHCHASMIDDAKGTQKHPEFPEFYLRRWHHASCLVSHPTSWRRHHRRRSSHYCTDQEIFYQKSVMARNNSGVRTVWEKNSPDSLVDLSARCVLKHSACLFVFKSLMGDTVVQNTDTESGPEREKNRRLVLRKDVQLPAEICEKLFSLLHEEGVDIEDNFVVPFSDHTRTRIRQVDVSGSSLTDRGLKSLIKYKLRTLNIHNCKYVTSRSLEVLNKNADRLIDLNIGSTVRFLPDVILPSYKDEDDDDEDEMSDTVRYAERGYIIKAPSLQRLTIHDLSITYGSNYFELLLKPLPNLTHLDLSRVEHSDGLDNLSFLKHCPNLTTLILHSLRESLKRESFTNISSLVKLRHLDISQFDDKIGQFANPNQILRTLVETLPDLTYLDISGTNLAGNGSFEPDCKGIDGSVSLCDIPGLVSRVGRPLEFLGLYRTHNDACCRAHIPAKRISGDANETQIITAGKHYLNRPHVLEIVLNDLFHIFRYENCANAKSALDVILMAMNRHPGEKVIQISGSASLYYIMRFEELNIKLKQKVLSTLLNGMFAHKQDAVMIRNGCLVMCRFQIPQDVLSDYERLVRMLLYVVCKNLGEDNDFVQRAGICLLNSLACQVDGQQKLLVGNLGAVEKMLEIIKEKLDQGVCDDVMEFAWSTMWNVTDETPINCKRFLDGGGMHLFLSCKEGFPDKSDLLRNMMGLLGNVAEVPELRPQLMTPNFVAEFKMLLESTSDGIEVSYNAAGVLAHMASDGPEAWTVVSPSREDVLHRMRLAIDRWDLSAERNINYRSFEPILRLLRVTHTPQCQHWAVWALANLTNVDGRYRALVDKEGGLQLLEELINGNLQPPPYSDVLRLANVVRDNVTSWKMGTDMMYEDAVEKIYSEDGLLDG